MHLENLSDTLMNVKKNEELHHKKQLAVNKNKLINRDAKAGIEEVKHFSSEMFKKRLTLKR